MKMTRLEKLLVNRPGKGQKNAERLRSRLADLPVAALREALELGCGLGTVAAVLADEYGLSVEGTDLDPEQIELARRHHGDRPGLRFAVEDATRLSYPDARFDLVVAHNVFHHLSEWGWAVHEVARVLRPGGYLLWLDFTLPAWMQSVLRWLRQPTLYTWPEIGDVFEAAGLVVVRERKLRLGPLAHHDVVLRRVGTRLLTAQSVESTVRSPARSVGAASISAHGSPF